MLKAAAMTPDPAASTPPDHPQVAVEGAAVEAVEGPLEGATKASADSAAKGSAESVGGRLEQLRAAPWVASTYFAEGLPFSIVHQVAEKFFLFMGASLSTVSLTALYQLAWNAKLLWSPLVDRRSTARRWLCATEALVGLLIIALAIPAQHGALRAVAWILVGVSFVAATHDISIDGFYLRALPDERRQAGFAGLRIIAYRLAMGFGGSVLVILAGAVSWRACFFVGGGVLVILAAVHAAYLPREAVRLPDRRPEAAGAHPLASYIAAFRSYLDQPRIAVSIAFILFYRAGDAMMFSMSSALQKSLGVGLTAQGILSGVTLGCTISGALLGGPIIARFSLKRALVPITFVQSLAILLYVGLAVRKPGIPWIVVAIGLEQFIAAVGNIALAVFLMRRCKGDYKATHFAIGSSLMSLALTGVGAVSGTLAQRLGFPVFFTLAYVASLPGVALSIWAPKD